MIHYQLHCAAGHDFDGWFKDIAAFDKQAKRGLLECPVCGGTKVARALMAPAVPRKAHALPAAVPAPAPFLHPSAPDVPISPASVPQASASQASDAAAGTGPASPPALTGHLPDHMRAMLQRLRAEVEKNCDYVGGEFAEEARRMQRGESSHRGIYGETSPDEAEALSEEGIEVSRIPWLPRADS
mgnify:CR=1 FL=1